MANTGNKQYALLVQYSATTGLPTGVVKPNVPGDPDYVAPVVDATGCPFTPIPDTHFTINNFTDREQAGPIEYQILTGVNSGTLQASESGVFAEPGEDHAIQITGERIGYSWGYYADTISYDAFLFEEGVLTALSTATYPGGGFYFKDLSGNIMINVLSTDRGYYGSSRVGAVQLGAGIGTATFSFQGNHEMIYLDSNNTFGRYDVRYETDIPVLTGTNSNDYPLIMEVTIYDGDWEPIDPDDEDAGGYRLPTHRSQTIEAGATVNMSFTQYREDFFMRISKQ